MKDDARRNGEAYKALCSHRYFLEEGLRWHPHSRREKRIVVLHFQYTHQWLQSREASVRMEEYVCK